MSHSEEYRNTPPLIPMEECWAILLVKSARLKADATSLCKAGLPSSYEFASQPGSNQSGLGKLLSRKRLQVQIPLTHLQSEAIERIPDSSTIEELLANRKKITFERRHTFMELIAEDLVAVRIRRINAAAIDLLFNGSGVKSATIFFRSTIVLRKPSCANWKKVFNFPCSETLVKAQVRWASVIFTSPAVPGSVDAIDDKFYRAEREKKIFSELNVEEGDREILARKLTPSAHNEALLEQLLIYLERRGVFWSKAGHLTKASLLNSDPKIRPQYAVEGLFPEPFLNRSNAYCTRGGLSLNGENCMKPEFGESEKSKTAPLILAAAKDLSLSLDTERQKEVIKVFEQTKDLIQGWHVKVNLEPYVTGMPLYGAAEGMGMGGF